MIEQYVVHATTALRASYRILTDRIHRVGTPPPCHGRSTRTFAVCACHCLILDCNARTMKVHERGGMIPAADLIEHLVELGPRPVLRTLRRFDAMLAWLARVDAAGAAEWQRHAAEPTIDRALREIAARSIEHTLQRDGAGRTP